MPNLYRRPRASGYWVSEDRDGGPGSYDLTPEGERFLTAVLSLKDGDEIRPADLALLIDRGWASAAPPEEPEVAAPPPVPEPPKVAPQPARRPEAARPGAGAGRRTRGREVALQILYQMEQNAGAEPHQIEQFIRRRLSDDKLQGFARALVDGVREHQARIDELISGAAENWRIDRMAAIDRNILRLGAYEMLYCPDVPAKVAINEALELAKRYSTAQSSRFVNGILDRLQGSDTEPVAPLPPPDEPTVGATPAPSPEA